MKIIFDDLEFEPYYLGSLDLGYQCVIETENGRLSIRRGKENDKCGLFVSDSHPYEVWYPERDAPDGWQTAEDIWNYIKKHTKK